MASILAISGSARRGSWNSRLLNIAADAVEVAGGKVTRLEMRDYPLPLYDEDLEKDEGLPPLVRQLRSLFVEHQGLLIASPEYNSSITPLLKNVIDWVSRPVVGEPPLAAFRGKVAAVFSASPGGLGGLRGLVHVRSIFGNIGVLVLPDQLAIPRAHQAFHADEPRFIDDGQDGAIRRIAAELVRVIDRLNG